MDWLESASGNPVRMTTMLALHLGGVLSTRGQTIRY